MIKVGDEVVTVDPLYFQNENVGNRLGRVISTTSYVLVELYEYPYNPVKCFQHEVELVHRKSEDELYLEEIENLFDDMFTS